MKRNIFKFDSVEYLTTMSATRFVSYSFYINADETKQMARKCLAIMGDKGNNKYKGREN